jgi:chloramphenicol O-acetyltransferase type A
MSDNVAMAGFIDLDTWKRREHFVLYSRLSHPFWSICVDVNVTRVWLESRESDSRSFSLAVSYLALGAANETEALRLRIRGEKVWLHDRVAISTTILRSDEAFSFGVFPMADSFMEFERMARAETERARSSQSLRVPAEGRDDLIYHSTLPWIRFTAFTNAMGRGDDSIPRLVFGRCSEERGRWVMPVSLEVHHGVVDGLDVARFLERFEQRLDSFQWGVL